MCDLHESCGATRAYPDRPISFAMFEYFVRSLPGVTTWSVADEINGERQLAILDDLTGHVELIAVPLESGNVGFQIKPSPSRRIQQAIYDRFRIGFVCDDRAHHVDFVVAETSNWRTQSAVA